MMMAQDEEIEAFEQNVSVVDRVQTKLQELKMPEEVKLMKLDTGLTL